MVWIDNRELCNCLTSETPAYRSNPTYIAIQEAVEKPEKQEPYKK